MMKKLFLLLSITALFFTSYAQTTGVFGGDAAASGYPNIGNTTNMWIKLGELTLNGNYNAAGLTVDFFPRNSNHGDSRQQLSVQFRNNNGTGLYITTRDVVLVHFHGQHKTIKDVKVVHTSGTAVTNNKLSVWVQMGVSWLNGVPIEVRTYGNVNVELTNQPYHTTITETGTVQDLITYYGVTGTRFEVNGDIKGDGELLMSGTGDNHINGPLAVNTITIPSGYKLAVAGKIISEGVKVELASSWPDYVFSKNYKLNSLEETESFIKEEGHLPNIPSASEVEENGIDLGEMNAKLLEKIEELTLHLIEMKKENKEFRERLETLESKSH